MKTAKNTKNQVTVDLMTRRNHEVDANYEAFKRLEPDLLESRRGQYALMRDGAIIDFHQTAERAFQAGRGRFPDGVFSFQEIGARTTFVW